uniref:ATP-dependent DNA helicase n=1 Tax=Steinernema glaseri TaxID=37863 RepID=A0A1I8ACR6_9BILA
IWERTLADAEIEIISTHRFRRFFALLLHHCRPANADDLLNGFLDRLAPPHINRDNAARRSIAFRHIAFYLQDFNVSLKELDESWPDIKFNGQELQDLEEEIETEEATANTDLEDGLPRGQRWERIARDEEARLNTDQRSVYDEIVKALDDPAPQRFFFVKGDGGTGKSFLYNALIAQLRAMGVGVEATAPTGIAAQILRGGKTAHSRFRIPNDLDEKTTPSVKYESSYAGILRDTKLIIIDEISMVNRTVLQHIDKTLRACYRGCDQESKLIFAGKCVLLSGDFKQ